MGTGAGADIQSVFIHLIKDKKKTSILSSVFLGIGKKLFKAPKLLKTLASDPKLQRVAVKIDSGFHSSSLDLSKPLQSLFLPTADLHLKIIFFVFHRAGLKNFMGCSLPTLGPEQHECTVIPNI